MAEFISDQHSLVTVASASSDDGDSESGESVEPSSKKVKITKTKGAARYRTKFNREWTRTYPFIKEVRGDVYSFLCTICRRQVGCSHQGRRDVERHIEKTMHKENVKATKSQSRFQPVQSTLTEKVIINHIRYL